MAGFAAVLVAAGGAAWVIGFTGVFGVRAIAVTGLRALPAATVLAAAGVPLGQPLARVDTGAVARRVRAVPGIERADVRRGWPSTLRITVTERRGVAVVVRAGAAWLVDGTGVVFQRLSAIPAGLPALTGAPAGPGDPATAAALSALAALTTAVRDQVATVAAATPDSVSLRLRDGRSVSWGGAADGAAKARVLAVLLGQPGTHYDVSTPSAVTVQ